MKFLESHSAVIFDMDGVIIDSEPFWRQSQMAAFAEVGVSLTEEDCASTKGWRIDHVVAHWFNERPWKGATPYEVESRIVGGVSSRVRDKGSALPGVHTTIEMYRQSSLPLALATSSAKSLIAAVLGALNLESAFDVVCSAEDERWGKPHPAVFLRAAQVLNVAPSKTTVIEDSLPGMLAAKAAGMNCVVVPDASEWEDPRWCLADAKLRSLQELVKAA